MRHRWGEQRVKKTRGCWVWFWSDGGIEKGEEEVLGVV